MAGLEGGEVESCDLKVLQCGGGGEKVECCDGADGEELVGPGGEGGS